MKNKRVEEPTSCENVVVIHFSDELSLLTDVTIYGNSRRSFMNCFHPGKGHSNMDYPLRDAVQQVPPTHIFEAWQVHNSRLWALMKARLQDQIVKTSE